jgi:hypothetical protein
MIGAMATNKKQELARARNEARKAYVAQIIDKQFNGVAADFARYTKIDPTYVNRMLYPHGRKGGKGIGEDLWHTITTLFGTPEAPIEHIEHDAVSPTRGQRAIALAGDNFEVDPAIHKKLHGNAVDIAVMSLAYALAANLPAATKDVAAMLRHLALNASPRPMAVNKGLFGNVLRIVEPNAPELADDDPLFLPRAAGQGKS